MIPTQLRLGYGTALVGLAVAVFGIVYAKWPFLLLSIYFGLCWVVWLVCALGRKDRRITPLVGLWMLIDVGILIQLIAFERAYGHGSLSGVEFLYVFSYAPVIFPSALILPIFEGIFSNKWQFWQLFGSGVDYVLPDWLAATLISAIQSLVIVVGVGRIRMICRSLTLRSTETGA